MRALLIFLVTLALVHCSCPKELSSVELVKNGECRGLYSRGEASSSTAAQYAIDKCASIGGKPVIIHDEEHNTYWKSKTVMNNLLVLGLVCNTTGQWEWADGSALDFKPAKGYYNPDLDKPCSDGRTWVLEDDGGYWSYVSSGSPLFLFYCTTQLQQANGCGNFEKDAKDGFCYQVGDVAQNFEDAEQTCQGLGATLASIHNETENAFIRQFAVSKGAVNGVLLGASVQGKDASFGWTDGSVMDYENYFPGFPKKNFGDCLAMDTSESKGQWMNVDCKAKLPPVCLRYLAPEMAPICTGEDYEEGEIITSPGYPYDASTPCDYFLSVDAGKKVEVNILMIEANTCCDSLYIYDGYLGDGWMAKVRGDKQNVTYTTSTSNIMRVSWQPNGGVNVRGFAMTYRAV